MGQAYNNKIRMNIFKGAYEYRLTVLEYCLNTLNKGAGKLHITSALNEHNTCQLFGLSIIIILRREIQRPSLTANSPWKGREGGKGVGRQGGGGGRCIPAP